jgi:hypothetical protein
MNHVTSWKYYCHQRKKEIKLVIAQSQTRFTPAVDSDSFCAAAHDITGAEVCWRHLATFHPDGHQPAAQVADASVSTVADTCTVHSSY